MSERRIPTPEEASEALRHLETDSGKSTTHAFPKWVQDWLLLAAAATGLTDQRGVTCLVAVFVMGVAWERAGFDVDPVPYLDPRRN